MFDNLNIDNSLLEYWKQCNLTEKDFYCRDCGKPLFDFSILEKIEYKPWGSKYSVVPFIRYKDSRKIFKESENERWVIKGRYLSGIRYQRKICWDCYFKKLPLLILEKKNSIKNKWMQKLRKNDLNHIPVVSQSPAFYFSLIFDISEDVLKTEIDKFITASPEFFKKKYGDNWKEKYEEYRKIQARAGCTLEYFQEKYGKEKGEEEYRRVCKDKGVSLENCVRKYGKEEGTKQFKEYCEVQRTAGCSLEYFQEKYGEKDGKKFYYELNHRKAITLENMVKAYGLEEGKIRYQKWAESTINNHIGYSKVSQELFKQIDKRLGLLAKESKWMLKNGEVEIEVVLNGYKKWIRPDYVLGNKIIEFNGDYWHCNPKFYNIDDIIPRFNNISESVKSVWENDSVRKTALEELGYKVFTVWENDYYLDSVKEIDRCIEFLTS